MILYFFNNNNYYYFPLIKIITTTEATINQQINYWELRNQSKLEAD